MMPTPASRVKTEDHRKARRNQIIRIFLILVFFPPLLSLLFGWLAAPSFLHPIRRDLSPDLIRQAGAAFAHVGARCEDFTVRAPDGILLHGWKVQAKSPSRNWVLMFHGVADNRIGVLDHSEFLLGAGYNVVMMDARAHGTSEGAIATYGWLERLDTRAIIDALESSEHPQHLFALGESMGAGIALQSAAADDRIEAVVAEASFASLREATYDYAGMQEYPLIGKTIFAPGAWMMLHRGQSLAGFPASEVSPEKAVASRSFPVLLICETGDTTLPCRHSRRIFAVAVGPKEIWVLSNGFHTAALGFEPAEFRRRVLTFFANASDRRKQDRPGLS